MLAICVGAAGVEAQSGWGTPTLIANNQTAGGIGKPLLGMNAAGDAFALSLSPTGTLSVWTRAAGGATWDETPLGASGTNHFALHVPATGRPRVLWVDAASGSAVTIKVHEYVAGTWSFEDSYSVGANLTALAAGGNSQGDVVTVFHRNDIDRVLAWRRTEADGWASSAETVSNLILTDFYNPFVAVSDTGFIRVSWVEPTPANVRTTTSQTNTGEWSTLSHIAQNQNTRSIDWVSDSRTGTMALAGEHNPNGLQEGYAAYSGGFTNKPNLTFDYAEMSHDVTFSCVGINSSDGSLMLAGARKGAPTGTTWQVYAGVAIAGGVTWTGGEIEVESSQVPRLSATRLSNGNGIALVSIYDSSTFQGKLFGYSLDGENAVQGLSAPLDLVSTDTTLRTSLASDEEGNAVGVWFTSTGEMFSVFYDGSGSGAGGGTSGGGTTGGGTSGGGGGTSGGSSAGGGGSTGGSTGGGAGGGDSSGGSGGGGSGAGGGGSGGGSGSAGGTGGGSNGGGSIGPVYPGTIPATPEVLVQGKSVTVRFQSFSGVGELAQKRKKKGSRRKARLLRMVQAMLADARVSASAVKAFAKRRNLGFEYEAEVVRKPDPARGVKAKKIKKTTKASELTLRDLESGRYTTRYRVRITQGSGRKKKNVGSTKWSASTEFAIA